MSDQPKRRLLSRFDKIALIITLLIIFFVLAEKIGCHAIKTEETIEWTDR